MAPDRSSSKPQNPWRLSRFTSSENASSSKKAAVGDTNKGSHSILQFTGSKPGGKIARHDLKIPLPSYESIPSPKRPSSLSLQRLEFGFPGSEDFRLILRQNGEEKSPWHDIPLYTSNGCINFVCTTPQSSWAQFEPATDEPSTPLKISSRGGNLQRYSSNAPFNIGFLPRTFADPETRNEAYGGLSFRGGPVEAVEICGQKSHLGEVYPLKPVAGFAMVDRDSRLRWLIVGVSSCHPTASEISTTRDVELRLGRELKNVREWFRTANCCSPGDPRNLFGLNERAVGQVTVTRLVADAHDSWQLLVDRNPPVSATSLSLGTRPASSFAYEEHWSRHYFSPSFSSSSSSSEFRKLPLCDPLSPRSPSLLRPARSPKFSSQPITHPFSPPPGTILGTSQGTSPGRVTMTSPDAELEFDLSLTHLPRPEELRVRLKGRASPPKYRLPAQVPVPCQSPQRTIWEPLPLPPGRSESLPLSEDSFSFPAVQGGTCTPGTRTTSPLRGPRQSPQRSFSESTGAGTVSTPVGSGSLGTRRLTADLAEVEQIYAHFAMKLEETRELLGRLRMEKERL